jgi:peptide deformylase
MILPVEVYGSQVLRRKSEPIDNNYPGLRQFIDDMWETMYHADGLGLAAPQVGMNIRVITIDATCMADEDPALAEFKKVVINPVIISTNGNSWIFNEGCLSLPGIREDVERASELEIEYYDEYFNYHKEKYDGVKARVLLHEYDHLEGVLFVDRISLLRKKLIKGKLNAITKGKADVSYTTTISK